MKKLFISIALIILVVALAQTISAEVGPAISERELVERLTRLEEGQKQLQEGQRNILREMDKRFEAMDKRFESIEKRFDQLISIFMAIVGAFAGIVAVTIVFAVWDRKTAIAPAMKRARELEEKEEKVERILRAYADQEPRLADVLRRFGLL